jgi:hypothetical protein
MSLLAKPSLAPDSSSPAKIQTNLQELTTTAEILSDLSDRLTKQITEIEIAVNKLNLGITANVELESWSDEKALQWETWRLAYGKDGGRWGFLLQRLSGSRNFPEADSYEQWAFQDLSRERRLRAVEKIPVLLDALVARSKKVVSELSGKLNYAQSLASTFAQPNSDGFKK